jgi:hypothetical protein
VPFLRIDMPRVLMPGESDTTSAAEKQEAFAMILRTMCGSRTGGWSLPSVMSD